MQIIDYARKGNVVRFYLGANGKQYGDDWDDAPYEYNAGEVYEEFIKGYKDISFPFDDIVLEPCDGEYNSPWCKNDMVKKRIPCIVVIKKTSRQNDSSWISDNFKRYASSQEENVVKYYFGDEMDP